MRNDLRFTILAFKNKNLSFLLINLFLKYIPLIDAIVETSDNCQTSLNPQSFERLGQVVEINK
jgi:hypothetical protein